MKKEEFVVESIKKMSPQAILLFGSYASGQQKPDSDLDILVIQETKRPFSERSGEIRSRIRTNIPLDIIVLTPKEARELPKKSSFFAQIIKEGKLLYGRI